MTLRSSLLSPILGVVVTSVVGACVPTSTAPPPGEEQRRAVLVRLADAVILPRLASLETDAQNLVDATVALEAARGADAVSRADAKSTLVKVLAQWQGLEVVQFGPAGAPATFTGGLGLRDGIHSWPQVSVCSADQQVVQDRFAEPDWAATRLVNVLGLHTLEYLLFREDPQNACPAAASINAEGTWAALGDAEVVARRATYARVLAADVLVKVQALREAWTGGFADQLKTAGVSGSPFPTAQQALDEVYAALFFVELKVKDRKLAVPAGLHIDCAADVCPELTESPFAHLSVQHIRDNLIGTRTAFVGTDIDGVDGPGFDDLLDDAGHTSAAVDMIGKLDAAITAAAGFTGTLEEALLTEPARVRDLHAVVKAFTDELKGTLPSLLGLRVPDEGAGDND